MEELQIVISQSLDIFTQKELNRLTTQQLKLLEFEDPILAQDIYREYLQGYTYKQKDLLKTVLSLILSWRAIYNS